VEGTTIHRQAVQFLCGLLLAAAVGMKLSYAFAPLAVILFLAVCRRSLLPPVIAGGLVGAGLLAICLAPSLANVIEGVFTYHVVTPVLWHREAALNGYFTAEYLAEFLNRRVFTDVVLTLLLVLVTGIVIARRAGHMAAADRRELWLIGGLMGSALLFGLLPRPPYIQYFMPFAAMTVLSLPVAWTLLTPAADTRRALILTATIIGGLPGTAVMVVNLPKLVQPEKWMVNRIDDTGHAIRCHGRRRCNGPGSDPVPHPGSGIRAAHLSGIGRRPLLLSHRRPAVGGRTGPAARRRPA